MSYIKIKPGVKEKIVTTYHYHEVYFGDEHAGQIVEVFENGQKRRVNTYLNDFLESKGIPTFYIQGNESVEEIQEGLVSHLENHGYLTPVTPEIFK